MAFFQNILVVCILYITLTVARPSVNDVNTTPEAMKLWKQNVNSALAFKCRPQPRAFDAEEIFKEANELISAAEIVSPYSTVLHRCDVQSGCCQQPNHQCGPAIQETAILWFRIVNNVDQTFTFKPVKAYNHTECICQSRQDQPKR